MLPRILPELKECMCVRRCYWWEFLFLFVLFGHWSYFCTLSKEMFEQNHYRYIAIVVPSIVWCNKCPKTYVYCAILIMVAANANSGRPAINYSRLFTKLKADLPEIIQKKLHNGRKKFYPSETQQQLLDVCNYKDFLTHLVSKLCERLISLSQSMQTIGRSLRRFMAVCHVQVCTLHHAFWYYHPKNKRKNV